MNVSPHPYGETTVPPAADGQNGRAPEPESGPVPNPVAPF